MSSVLTSFRFRRDKSWNGSSFLVSRSNATASASMTKLFVPSLTHYVPRELRERKSCAQLTRGTCSTRSGYFALMFSEFRLNTAISPPANMCT